MKALLFLVLLLMQQTSPQQSRPTDPRDPMPPPDMDYFIGTWTFDWNVPESPLGPGGKIKGTEICKKVAGKDTYESEIKGEGPNGSFKGRATTSYNAAEKMVTRREDDFVGISTVKSGPIGGDLGGYYTIYWESTPIKKGGKVTKLKGKTLMLSPAHYKLQVEISVDGGPYTSLGNAWYRKTDLLPEK
jgi:hypothetical protein